MLKTVEQFREESTLQSSWSILEAAGVRVHYMFLVGRRQRRAEGLGGVRKISGLSGPPSDSDPWRVARKFAVDAGESAAENHGTKGRWRGLYNFDDTEVSRTLGASLAGTCNISSCLASIRWFQVMKWCCLIRATLASARRKAHIVGIRL
jgi:hypothetical protein